MTLTPTQKQALSTTAMAVFGATLAAVEQVLANPPFTLHTLLVAAGAGTVTGIAHLLPTFGTADKVQAKAQAIATAAVNGEPK